MSFDTPDSHIFYLQATDARFFDALWSALSPQERASTRYADLRLLNATRYHHHDDPLSTQPIHTADVCFELVQRGLSADLGLAPLLAARANIPAAREDIAHASTATWLRLTPVYWAAARDHVNVHNIYGESKEINPSAQDWSDWQAIFQTVQPWLSELGWTITPADNETVAYIRAPNGFDYHAPSLAYAQSDMLEAFLPQGRDLKRWQTLLTELQMLLHTHPINQARTARGARPINSFWLDQNARAEQIPVDLVAQTTFLNTPIPRITFASDLDELTRLFAPVAAALRAGKTAHLSILTDTPYACAHQFEFIPLTIWQKIQSQWRRKSLANDTAPFTWLTQHCCEDGV